MRSLIDSPVERKRFGAVVSFENDAGERLTIARCGEMPQQAVRHACQLALEQDPSFRVVCVSTPETVYRDLKGRAHRSGRAQLVEGFYLGRGLDHMLHPRLRRSQVGGVKQ